jgi:rsbT co-antagonist protein RsbR
MKEQDKGGLAAILKKHETEILSDWIREQSAGQKRKDPIQEAESRRVSKEFLSAAVEAAGTGAAVEGREWDRVREILSEMSASRASQGSTPTETAMFVFSLKQPVFTRLRAEHERSPEGFAEQSWLAATIIDKLGLFTTEAYQKSREGVINRQQRELLELSTPVVQLWDDILALPLIGTLDSGRTQVVMESLLEKIVSTGASIAIIDITGVPTVDTLVAQHLMKTVAAARLMGADCIISGIRPQIAQTIVHLGVDLSAVTTKASLGDAFAVALTRVGLRVDKIVKEKA